MALARFLFNLFLNLVFTKDRHKIGQKYIKGRVQFVWLSEHVGRKIFLGVFERKETDFVTREIQPGDICFDVGANVGYFTHLFASLTGPDGMVVSIGRVKGNVMLIELASELNLTSDFVDVYHAAASDSPGVIHMSPNQDSSYSNVQGGSKNGGHEVSAVTIAQVFDQMSLPRIDILKMDIEGWELKALHGMSPVFENKCSRPRLMMIELYSPHIQKYGDSIEGILSYLSQYGYKAYVLDKNRELIPFEKKHVNLIYNVFFKHEDA